MPKLLTLVFLTLTLAVYGQDKDTTVTRHKLIVGFSFSPNYAYRTLTKRDKNVSAANWGYAKSFSDSIEIPKAGYTLGASISYYLTPKLFLESGIFYANKGYKTVPVQAYVAGENTGFNYLMATYALKYSYLDIPLRAYYTFFEQNKLQLFVGLGATLNILLQSDLVPEPKQATDIFVFINKPNEESRINISPTVSLGLQYPITEKMDFRVEPNFQYGIWGVGDKFYRTTHLWNAGLSLGYYYRLR